MTYLVAFVALVALWSIGRRVLSSNDDGAPSQQVQSECSNPATSQNNVGLEERGNPRGPHECLPEAAVGAPQVRLSTCTVARIIDGDTLACLENNESVRLLLIDTPEMGQGESGLRAAIALGGLAPIGTLLKLEYDVRERDRYGRILAYGYVPSGVMINEELAVQGFAVDYYLAPNDRHLARIRRAVAEAQSARRGLWSSSGFACLPASYRVGRC